MPDSSQQFPGLVQAPQAQMPQLPGPMFPIRNASGGWMFPAANMPPPVVTTPTPTPTPPPAPVTAPMQSPMGMGSSPQWMGGATYDLNGNLIPMPFQYSGFM